MRRIVALCLLALGCRHRHRPRRVAPSATARSAAPLLIAAPAGASLAVGGGRYLAGGIRVEGAMRAGPPYPLRTLVSAQPTTDGWRFVAEDGTRYAAASFTGALRVVTDVTDAGAAGPPSERETRDAELTLDRALPAHDRAPLPLPASPEFAVGRSDGAVDVLRGDEVLRYDARSLRVLRRADAPGNACVLHRAWLGTRAVCTHDGGWARAVFAEERGWAAIRDELHAQPMGDLAFDDRSELWAVGAPCTERATPDGAAVCVYRADGRRTDVALPFDGAPVSAHAGAVLFVESLREAESALAAVWRDGALTPVTLPVPPAAARAARLDDHGIAVAHGTTWVRVALSRGGTGLTRVEAPPGARSLVAGDGVVFARGADRVWRLRGGRFMEVPVPIAGDRGGVDLSAGDGWCAGPWCRLSDRVWWNAVGERASPAISRGTAAP